MTELDLMDKINNHVGGKWVLVITCHETSIHIRDIKKYLDELSPEAIDAFWQQYPYITDRDEITHAVIVNDNKFKEAATVHDDDSTTYTFGHECLARLDRMFFPKAV